MATDDEVIEQARRRQAHGNDTEIDRYRLRAAERREQQMVTKEMPLDGNLLVVRKVTLTANDEAEYAINPEVAQALNEWWDEKLALAMQSETVLDPIGFVLAEASSDAREEMHAEVNKVDDQIKELRAKVGEQALVIAELRGEL